MTVLITGGAGFIGSNFILEWVKSTGEMIINLDKLTYAGNPDNLSSLEGCPSCVFVQGDIGDSQKVDALLSQYKPRAILNFAAESHVDRSIHGPADFIETNIVATFNLLESVRGYWSGLPDEEKSGFRFLHVSTDEVYGSLEKDEAPFTEKNQYAPNSPYSASKASSDHLVRAYHHTYGLPVVTTNCSNNYGPYQFPEKLIPLMIHRAVTGGELPIYGDGQNIRDWLYVTDHCAALRIVLEKGHLGETYNIGGWNEKANLDVVHALCDELDRLRPKASGGSYREQMIFVKDRPGHDRRYAIDSSKIFNELGWKPQETFESGLEKTIRWYLDNPKWIENITSGAYRDWVKKHYAA